MNLPLLSKLLVSACTVGGGSFGAYVAGFMGNNETKQEILRNEESDSSLELGSGSSEGKREEGKVSQSDNKGEEQQTSGETRERKESLSSKPIQKDLREDSDSHSDQQDPATSSEPREPEFSFDSELLQSELQNSVDISTELEEDEVETQQISEEEKFDDFEEYEKEDYDSFENDDDLEEDGEEGIFSRRNSAVSLEVAEYVVKEEEDYYGTVTKVSCKKWIRGYGDEINEREMDRQDCESKKKITEWGKKKGAQSKVWLDVEKSKARKVLNHYGLWSKELSEFTTLGKSKWITKGKDNSLGWECVRENSPYKNNFWISCEYYREPTK
ncbi:hypothetical protein [Mycoplasma suis]|uniref:Uncharacterized protein n=1 Tax=Mycoplasma suis (strain Illinois) TaxID=768700 RepID=F0QQL8_MYCSL|nr:hypothetical protein [Mycoplasma suis]ADX97788.1 hypothetical protein MSU_0244 [Mycoplasma suis str. Illinois]